jgi:hypothetical protein
MKNKNMHRSFTTALESSRQRYVLTQRVHLMEHANLTTTARSETKATVMATMLRTTLG